jgi:hypothetical protein
MDRSTTDEHHSLERINSSGSATGPAFIGLPLGGRPVAHTGVSTSPYKNHGAYVKASDNKEEAAQSCIGMPRVND